MTTAAPRTYELNPDELAELEREREFLLRSLDDLDAERDAGDLDGDDHAGLFDDYTRRLAEVQRSIEQRRKAFAEVDNKLSSGQRVVTVVLIVAVAVLAGFLLARASGFRSPTDSLSGDIRQSSVGLLAEADTLTREGRWEEAIEVYDEALLVSPSNVEALSYRGWITARLGDNEAGLADLGEAVAVDPEYPDARVFTAILLDDEGRFAEAADQLEIFDGLDAPEEILGLVEGSNLRGSVAAGQIVEVFGSSQSDQPIDLGLVKGTLDDMSRGGAILTQVGEVVLAQRVFSAVLIEDPDQLIALVGKGQLAREPDLWSLDDLSTAEDALAALDRAVDLSLDIEEGSTVRLYRSDARFTSGDTAGAQADLPLIDRDALSVDLQALYDDLSARLN